MKELDIERYLYELNKKIKESPYKKSELAEMLGVSNGTITNIISGSNGLIKKLIELEKILGGK